MAAPLVVVRLSLAELFSDSYMFTLPWYQRTYAWMEEHARCLLEDIHSASRSEDGWYPLGDIILSRRGDDARAAVIDGQQRLITLSILFAILRDRIEEEELAKDLHARLWHSGRAPSRRINPKEFIDETLLHYVQEAGGTKKDPENIVYNKLTESERNIIENRNAIRDMLVSASQSELVELARFMLDNCYLVAQSVEEERIAIQMFVKAQDSGLRLAPTDMLKVSVLNHVPPELRDDLARVWDGCAARLGDDGLAALLRSLCDIRRETKRAGPVEVDLIRLYDIKSDAAGFITSTLQPMAELAIAIRDHKLGTDKTYDKINCRLSYLNLVKHDEWMAPVLHWLAANMQDVEATQDFLIRLERFAYVNMLNHVQKPKRMADYQLIIQGIDDGSVLQTTGPLTLYKSQITSAVRELRRSKFYTKRYKTQILLRVEGAVREDDRPRIVPRASIEHVFPRGARKKSVWKKVFSDENKAADYIHRLGNLTPLTEEENREAGVNDYDVKRKVFERSKFHLSRRSAGYEKWDYETIDERTETIIDMLLNSWELK